MKKNFIGLLAIPCLWLVLLSLSVSGSYGCGQAAETDNGGGSTPAPGPASTARSDGAQQLSISSSGSLQNSAWSPDGTRILFTRWRSGYNAAPADLFIVNVSDGSVTTLVSDGSSNVNLPASSWNGATNEIIFSSDREPHDEAYVISASGAPGSETRVTDRASLVVFEPSLSPDGQTVVFESHQLDVDDNGIITKYRRDGVGGYVTLTDAADDCRQPVWSPVGDRIVYQRRSGGQWDLWTMNTDGTGKTQLMNTAAVDETDPSFSPDGSRIVYSSNEGGLAFANLFVIPAAGGASTRVTNFSGYDGAPGWSPDGAKIAFESSSGDPDGSAGTSLWVIDAPSP